MKKWLLYAINALIMGGAIALILMAPDTLSKVIVAVMAVIVLVSGIFGVIPIIQYSAGFDTAIKNIARAQSAQTSMPWLFIAEMEDFFNQRLLDQLFEDYKQKVEQERKSNMIVSAIDETINEDELALRCWQGVVLQIPSILTGLGLLGTFIGLITGISSIEVSSVDAALSSIQVLFNGIQVAFYTSISGIILSIVYNIMYKIVWNIMVRDYGMFMSLFQRNVIPTVEEQTRYSQKKEMEQIQEHLERLPNNNHFSVGAGAVGGQGNPGNEAVLMPQVLNGLQNHEFTFFLQPRFDLNNRAVVGAEALVRWKHPKLGMVAPSVFVPILEKNGYITRLDQYLWEQVCVQLREWLDAGIRPVPISVNISKTDVLAMDIAEFFSDLVQKYRLPPRCIEFDVAQNAYLEARSVTTDFVTRAQQKGFRIVVDGFRGDFFALHSGETPMYADAYKLDLRFFKDPKRISAVAEQALGMKVAMVAEGIENMEQMALLRKSGVGEGQGFYLSKALPVDAFEKMMNWRNMA